MIKQAILLVMVIDLKSINLITNVDICRLQTLQKHSENRTVAKGEQNGSKWDQNGSKWEQNERCGKRKIGEAGNGTWKQNGRKLKQNGSKWEQNGIRYKHNGRNGNRAGESENRTRA